MLSVLRQDLVLQNMFMNEEEGSSCCDTQEMSLEDDAMSDIKQQNILVPQVIVSCSVFMSFALIVCKDIMKFAYYHI
jgi:hypothetical protein